MNIEEFRDYCLIKAHVTESFPFDQHTLVFKVDNKMFALTGLENKPISVNLKCNPEKSIELRDHYNEVTAGYHMSKKHWISSICLFSTHVVVNGISLMIPVLTLRHVTL